ncbi:MAG: HTH domain-containing protein [Firmicutes bacterium]|nr:HTH domain-containing protein [Bacillota bacterium]
MLQIEKYLKDNIDDEVSVTTWNAKRYLSLQLASMYSFYHVTILETEFLLMKPVKTLALTRMQHHMNLIIEKTHLNTVLLFEDVSPYLVKEMLKKKIGFISENKQMYLPFLALHLKKQRGTTIEEERFEFTAATQMVFLKMLYSAKLHFEIEQLAEELELSKMTVLRAIEELQNKRLLNIEIGGQTRRKKLIYPIDKREYYRTGKQYLIDPVRKNIYVRELPDGTEVFRGGLSALGEKTMLAEPEREILAIYENMGRLRKYQVTQEEALEKGFADVQVMKYDIRVLTEDRCVDPISLILSLHERDERIDMAIEEMMGEYEWYEG